MHLLKKYNWLVIMMLFLPAEFTQAQLTIQNAAFIQTTGNSIITLQNTDLVNNGSLNQNIKGRVVFTGTSDNIISGGGNTTFGIIEIAKSNQATTILFQNINIDSSINFTSGLIDLNGYNILLQPGAFIVNENENSRIKGSKGGYLQITQPLNAPAAVNPGNLGAIITSAQNMGSTIIRRGNVSQTNAYSNGNSILRYYDIIPANNNSLNATFRFNYFDAELNGLNENTLDFWKSPNNNRWTNIGTDSRDITNNYVEKTGIADFSRFTLSSAQNALPVIFASFNVECINGQAQISWKTAHEQNSSYFEIQKSIEGIQWSVVARITAAGNNDSEKNYSYTDMNTLSGKVLYRVADYDINGSVMYSRIASSACGIDNSDVLIYPNPVKDILWVSVNNPAPSILKIELADSKSTLIRSQVNAIIAGNNKCSINMQGVPNGLYIISLSWNNGDKIKTLKIIKE